MRKVKALSWLAGGSPRGCNVGIFLRDEAVARAAALFVDREAQIMSYDIELVKEGLLSFAFGRTYGIKAV